MSMRTWAVVSFSTTECTVGKGISRPLNRTAVRLCLRAHTSTPSHTVNPRPRECILAGSSCGIILKTHEILPGAKALAWGIACLP